MHGPIRIVIGTLIVASLLGGAASPAAAQNAAQKKILEEKCKAASFARRPAGTMASTMRDVEIKRCIKNGGALY